MAERLIFLVGPTAIGKTEISLELAGLAGGEIISCDSMQVYEGMNIGTSKPPQSALDSITHHLIDIVGPEEEFSVARFRQLAVEAIEDIIVRDKIPLIVGGSGLYFKVLIDGIFEGPVADRKFRRMLEDEAAEFGAGALYERLCRVDKISAEKIHPNDARRIIRALEVYEKADEPISKLKAGAAGLEGKYEIRVFGLNMDRAALYKKIDERVDLMFDMGFFDEAKALAERNLSLTASQALGYKEVFGFLKGEYDFEETKRLVKRNTRRYAKRQLTWFRRDKRVEWIMVENGESPAIIAGRIMNKCSNNQSLA
ncbi:MAG: tRNA (adenosine(37)-N6)-dimethylallyltransferase MiaA [Candidatus Omnitrophota bacterium]